MRIEYTRNYFDFATIAPTDGTAADWADALKAGKQALCPLFKVGEGSLSLHLNTTSAFKRVFARIRQLSGSRPLTLLTTDLDYPGIIAHLDEAWEGKMILAQISDLVWKKDARKVDEALRSAFLMSRPDVILISHVSRSTGWVLSPKLLRSCSDLDPRVVTIVDGAQAVGNLPINSVQAMRNQADFYVFSIHKWLCCKPTLGVVIADQQWRTGDPSQGYNAESVSGGSGSKEVLLSIPSTLRALRSKLTPGRFRARRRAIDEFVRAAKGVGYQLPLGLSQAHHTSGLVVLSKSDDLPGDVPRKAEKGDVREEDKVIFHIFGESKWRPAGVGGQATGPRFLLSPILDMVSGKSPREPVERVEDLSDEPVPIPIGGATTIRFCFHAALHEPEDIERLTELIEATGGPMKLMSEISGGTSLR